MSLILDALKKSEAERQSREGPTLMEVRLAEPRRRYPLWVLWIGALLLVNLGGLLWFALRSGPPAAREQPTVASASGTTPNVAPVAAPGVPLTTINSPASSAIPAAGNDDAAGVGLPPGQLTTHAPAGTANDIGPLDNSLPANNPADEMPAVAASDGMNRHQGRLDEATGNGSVRIQASPNSEYNNLPNAGEIQAHLPELRLDLHSWSERPADRYALINMHRVREGDMTPEGVRVMGITREGVALSYQGHDFMLRPQGQ